MQLLRLWVVQRLDQDHRARGSGSSRFRPLGTEQPLQELHALGDLQLPSEKLSMTSLALTSFPSFKQQRFNLSSVPHLCEQTHKD